MSTDPADVAAAMAAGERAEADRGAAGLDAVQGGPPAEVRGPMFPPLQVQIVPPVPAIPLDEAEGTH